MAAPTDGSDEDDEFHDADDGKTNGGSPSRQSGDCQKYVEQAASNLHQGITDCNHALELFLNNEFEAARGLVVANSETSMYHSLGYAVLLYIQAVLTFDREVILTAGEAIRQSQDVNDKCRRKSGYISKLSKQFRRPDYNHYSEVEIHAELNYAESLFMRAMITFVEDENLVGFIRGGLKIRQCYNSYKECVAMLEDNESRGDIQRTKDHFESGVRMGSGAFNVVISQLPTRVMKLLEFIGFSGNLKVGVINLEEGSRSTGLRAPLCTMFLISYHSIHSFIFGTGDGDIQLCEQLLQPLLRKYPKGAMTLFFHGRISEIKGIVDLAIQKFEESIASQSEWLQFHHLCFWELMWCHSFKCEWNAAAKYAYKLSEESRWSKATYLYQQAAFLSMNSETNEQTLKDIYMQVPGLKQRIAGKSIPIEKFCVKKAQRYLDTEKRLVLPAFEVVYLWNGFLIIGKNRKLLFKVLDTIIDAEKQLKQAADQAHQNVSADDECLISLLKGMCFRWLGEYRKAEQNFQKIQSRAKDLEFDTHLVPFSLLELSLLYMMWDKSSDAQRALDATKTLKGYSLESRLHFRVHAAYMKLADLRAGGNGSGAGSRGTGGSSSETAAASSNTPDRRSSLTDSLKGNLSPPARKHSTGSVGVASTNDDAFFDAADA